VLDIALSVLGLTNLFLVSFLWEEAKTISVNFLVISSVSRKVDFFGNFCSSKVGKLVNGAVLLLEAKQLMLMHWWKIVVCIHLQSIMLYFCEEIHFLHNSSIISGIRMVEWIFNTFFSPGVSIHYLHFLENILCFYISCTAYF